MGNPGADLGAGIGLGGTVLDRGHPSAVSGVTGKYGAALELPSNSPTIT
jgi:hypothetical protein